ncbi:MAG: hypothetical protein HC900_07120 [Methylacidiphilales bacterium]|nr:hypothetical protein [Candidatus Methylacidiphilales bacterium]
MFGRFATQAAFWSMRLQDRLDEALIGRAERREAARAAKTPVGEKAQPLPREPEPDSNVPDAQTSA